VTAAGSSSASGLYDCAGQGRRARERHVL